MTDLDNKPEEINLSEQFIRLTGAEKEKALKAVGPLHDLRKSENEYLARRRNIRDMQVLEPGFLRPKAMKIVLSDCILNWRRFGYGFFHTQNMFPVFRWQHVLRAREPVFARTFGNDHVLMIVPRRGLHYKNLLRWMGALFTLSFNKFSRTYDVYTVPKPVFKRFFQSKLTPTL